RDVEVALAAGRPADADVVVGEAHVQALAIGLGVDGDGRDPELFARTDHPQGDLPAVGDEDFLEHQGMRSIAPAAAAPGVPPSRFPEESTPETLSANSLGLVA